MNSQVKCVGFGGGIPNKILMKQMLPPVYNFHTEKWVEVVPLHARRPTTAVSSLSNTSPLTQKEYLIRFVPIKDSVDPIEYFKRISELREKRKREIKPRVPSRRELFLLDYGKPKKQDNPRGEGRGVVNSARVAGRSCLNDDELTTNTNINDPVGYLLETNRYHTSKRHMSNLLQHYVTPREFSMCLSRDISDCSIKRERRRPNTAAI